MFFSFLKITAICLLVSLPFVFLFSNNPFGKGMRVAIVEIGIIIFVITPLFLLLSSIFRLDEWEFIRNSLLARHLKRREG
jgi:hypothetical protein